MGTMLTHIGNILAVPAAIALAATTTIAAPNTAVAVPRPTTFKVVTIPCKPGRIVWGLKTTMDVRVTYGTSTGMLKRGVFAPLASVQTLPGSKWLSGNKYVWAAVAGKATKVGITNTQIKLATILDFKVCGRSGAVTIPVVQR